MISELIYKPLRLVGYGNDLEREYLSQSLRVKIGWWRGVLSRELTLWLTGQKFLQRKYFELKGKQHTRILWFYDGLSLGDCIMDLSQRQIIADHATIDLCITRGPASLFVGDPAVRAVYTKPEQCLQNYDFVLMYNLSTYSIRIKRRYFKAIPFATTLDHQQGECYDRITYSWLRLCQLFRLPVAANNRAPVRPNIVAADVARKGHVCVALGSVDRRRRYSQWADLLHSIVTGWPAQHAAPRFVLVGNGESAQEALAQIAPAFIECYCEIRFDLPVIDNLKDEVALCECFLGVDGGVMHLAEALNKRGVAVFTVIKPAWRLLDTTRLKTIAAESNVNDIKPNAIAALFLQSLTEYP